MRRIQRLNALSRRFAQPRTPILLIQDSYMAAIPFKHFSSSISRAVIHNHDFELAVKSLAENTVDSVRDRVRTVEHRDYNCDSCHRHGFALTISFYWLA